MVISVCVPIHNVSPYIERCARSIFEQTNKDYEVIFVDDCSPDDSIEVLERVLLDYPDIKDKVTILHHPHHCGLAATRNTAVSNAHGDFIMHVDSDDWLELDAIEKLVRKQKETDADIVSGSAVIHYEDHDTILPSEDYSTKEEMTLKMVELTLDHVLWRRLIKSSLYKDNSIQATEGINIGEDHYTLPRLIYYANSHATVDEIVYHYNCCNENSYTNIKTYEEEIHKKYSDLNSIDILTTFFSDKDASITDRLSEIKAELYCYLMDISFLNHDSTRYNDFAKHLLSMDKKYLVQFRLDNYFRKIIKRTYYTYYCYKIVKNLVLYFKNRLIFK